MNERQVADYLSAHPEFFEQHAELLAAVQLKSPHRSGVISLQERQMVLLRDKNRQLEQRIATLLRYGQDNDAMADKLLQLTERLLAERDPYAMPRTLLTGLRDIFDLPHTALQLWDTVENAALADFTSGVHPNLRPYADQLLQPVCGRAADIEAIQWFEAEHKRGKAHCAEVDGLGSAALIALRRSTRVANADRVDTESAFGLITLGASDPARFDAEMATDFLARIGVLSSAALAHLAQTSVLNLSPSVELGTPP